MVDFAHSFFETLWVQYFGKEIDAERIIKVTGAPKFDKVFCSLLAFSPLGTRRSVAGPGIRDCRRGGRTEIHGRDPKIGIYPDLAVSPNTHAQAHSSSV